MSARDNHGFCNGALRDFKRRTTMSGNENIVYCSECTHCFKDRRSSTGYSCEVWGYDDFACSVPLNGYCHKAKPMRVHSSKPIKIDDILKGQ